MPSRGWLKPELLQVVAAMVALLLGLLVYLSSRDPQQVYFLSYIRVLQSGYKESGILSDFLPSLLHTYAFILLTVAVLSASLAQTRLICIFWSLLECMFEIGQHKAIAIHLSEYQGNIRFLEVTAEYFLNGTFDLLDIVAIAIGACMAYATVSISFSVLNSGKEKSLS